MAELAERLRDRIRRDGPMPFWDWMEACLYDAEEGYYMRPGRKTGAGPDADFATSPTLHPWMARAIAHEAAETWRTVGKPHSFTVVESGGGEGDLARDALAWLDAEEAELAAAVSWTHVERSPYHREAQVGGAVRRGMVPSGDAAQVDKVHGPGVDGPDADGHDPRIRSTDAMPHIPAGLVVAHEFLDALPFHWLEWDGGTWRGLLVALEDERFTLARGDAPNEAMQVLPPVEPEPGQRVVAMPAVRDWIGTVATRLQAGAVVVVDYGDPSRWLWSPDRPDGTVRGFRAHQIASVLEAPGETDITASIDFDLLAAWGDAAGLAALPLEKQTHFLARHGALEALAAMPKDSLEDASAYLRLKQMVLPGGMGDAFKVQRFWKRGGPQEA